jgi:hypothetical protein
MSVLYAFCRSQRARKKERGARKAMWPWPKQRVSKIGKEGFRAQKEG